MLAVLDGVHVEQSREQFLFRLMLLGALVDDHSHGPISEVDCAFTGVDLRVVSQRVCSLKLVDVVLEIGYEVVLVENGYPGVGGKASDMNNGVGYSCCCQLNMKDPLDMQVG